MGSSSLTCRFAYMNESSLSPDAGAHHLITENFVRTCESSILPTYGKGDFYSFDDMKCLVTVFRQSCKVENREECLVATWG